MAKLNKKGYGQVEPNHLAGQKSGAIYAMLPAASSIDVVENGMFMKYGSPPPKVRTFPLFTQPFPTLWKPV